MEHAASNVSEIDKVEGKEITEFHLEGEAEQTAQASEETKRQIRKKRGKTPAAKTESSKPKTANNSQKQAVSHKKLLQAEQSE